MRKEKRANAFGCLEKYTPSHNCARKKTFSVHMIEEGDKAETRGG